MKRVHDMALSAHAPNIQPMTFWTNSGTRWGK